MATIVTRYISAASAGGDGTTTALSGANAAYASIAAWVAARLAVNTNFVTADVIEKGVCLPDAVFTGTVSVTGATTDNTRYWWLTASVRNNGIPGSGVVIDNNFTALAASGAIATFDPYTRFDSIEIKNIRTAADSQGTFVMHPQGGVFEGLLVHGAYAGTNQRPYAIVPNTSSPTHGGSITNCVVKNIQSVWNTEGISLGDAGAITVANCTVANMNGAGSVVAGIVAGSRTTNVVKNCLVLGMSGTATAINCFVGTWGTANNNASSDATAPGTSSLTSLTAANEVASMTVGGEILQLITGAQCLNAGETLTVDYDIANTARPVSTGWDIGAFEGIYVPPPPVTPIRINQSGLRF